MNRHCKQRHTARRVYDHLKAEYGEFLSVGARTIQTLVKEEKEKIYKINKNAHLRLEHPGGEAQIDFGEVEVFEKGVKKILYELVLSFPKSNAGFVVLTRSQAREALLEAML